MKSMFIISLDFELFWGVHDKYRLEKYKENIEGVGKVIPHLLNLFEKYDIHATWATVGFMFSENALELNQFIPEKEHLPTYNNQNVSPYGLLEENKTVNYEKYYFAPRLIEQVSCAKGQEIGSHTFSHYYCKEKGQTPKQFDRDISASIAIAKSKNYSLKSIVLPRNQCDKEYIKLLKKWGFTSYRDEENDWIHKISFFPLKRILRLIDVYISLTGQGGYIPVDEEGIVNLVGSRMYKPYVHKLCLFEPLKIRRIKKQMLHAAKNNLTFHLWWHPHNIGVNTEIHLAQLNEIFEYYQYLNKKYGMQSLNMTEAVSCYRKNN